MLRFLTAVQVARAALDVNPILLIKMQPSVIVLWKRFYAL